MQPMAARALPKRGRSSDALQVVREDVLARRVELERHWRPDEARVRQHTLGLAILGIGVREVAIALGRAGGRLRVLPADVNLAELVDERQAYTQKHQVGRTGKVQAGCVLDLQAGRQVDELVIQTRNAIVRVDPLESVLPLSGASDAERQ